MNTLCFKTKFNLLKFKLRGDASEIKEVTRLSRHYFLTKMKVNDMQKKTLLFGKQERNKQKNNGKTEPTLLVQGVLSVWGIEYPKERVLFWETKPLVFFSTRYFSRCFSSNRTPEKVC